jgi:hypothetical protein
MNIHFFDLDGVLWKTNAHWWIVNKDKPTKPVMRITQEEGAKCISGEWKEHGYHIKGVYDAWLSEEMFQKTNKHLLSNLDLRFDEFNEKKYLQQQAKNIEFYIDNIMHLSNINDEIAILTARGNKDNHNILLDKLNNILKNNNIKLSNKIYFVNDDSKKRLNGSSSYLKANILLEHLVGFKINDNGFFEEQDEFEHVVFYDDEWKNIETSLNLKDILYNNLNKSDTKFQKAVKERLRKNKTLLCKHILNDTTKEFLLHL